MRQPENESLFDTLFGPPPLPGTPKHPPAGPFPDMAEEEARAALQAAGADPDESVSPILERKVTPSSLALLREVRRRTIGNCPATSATFDGFGAVMDGSKGPEFYEGLMALGTLMSQVDLTAPPGPLGRQFLGQAVAMVTVLAADRYDAAVARAAGK